MSPQRASRLLFQLPQDSRIFRALQPANNWGWEEVLLNKANYLLDVLVWQQSNKGVKKTKQTKKPELFKPEFMKDESQLVAKKELTSYETTEIDSILSKPRL